MTERPIIFSAPMVRALLAGTKTQTRRGASKPVRHPDLGNWYTPGALVLEHEPQHVIERACPYGQPGDRLWVRETWAECARRQPLTDEDLPWQQHGRILVYAADPEWNGARLFVCADGVARWAKPERWRPSIFMPRWASRITMEVTGVRVERLQDISEADAIAEGCTNSLHLPGGRFANENYQHLWWQINGDGSWEANPWVWVVEFKRVAP